MDLIAQTRVAFPRELVFTTYRDKLPELVPFLPNVSSIVVKERVDQGEKTKLVNLWTGKTDIPSAAQRFIKPEMFMWTDFADWDRDTWTCHWRSETHAFPGLIECSGKTVYEPVGEATELRITGALILHLEKAHVPRLLAGTVRPLIEKLVVGNLKPNLLSTGGGVEKYLQSRSKA